MSESELPNGFSHQAARMEAVNLFHMLKRGESVEGLRKLIAASGTDAVAAFRRRVLEFFNEFVAVGTVVRRPRQRRGKSAHASK